MTSQRVIREESSQLRGWLTRIGREHPKNVLDGLKRVYDVRSEVLGGIKTCTDGDRGGGNQRQGIHRRFSRTDITVRRRSCRHNLVATHARL